MSIQISDIISQYQALNHADLTLQDTSVPDTAYISMVLPTFPT